MMKREKEKEMMGVALPKRPCLLMVASDYSNADLLPGRAPATMPRAFSHLTKTISSLICPISIQPLLLPTMT